MEYYLIQMGFAKNRAMTEWEHHNWICANLKTAIKCANHKAFVYDFKPLDDNQNWEGVADLIKYYDKGWISIEKKKMWEKEWD